MQSTQKQLWRALHVVITIQNATTDRYRPSPRRCLVSGAAAARPLMYVEEMHSAAILSLFEGRALALVLAVHVCAVHE